MANSYGMFIVRTEQDRTDRIGLRTLMLSQRWQPSAGNLSVLENDAEEPQVPVVPGGVILIGRERKPVPGGFRTYWTFEGINGDGKDVTFKDRTNSIDYRFEPGMGEQSLLILPNIQDLLSQFNGYPQDGQIVWQPTLATTGSSGPMVGATAGATNPLFGYQTFFGIDGTYHYRYVEKDPTKIPLLNAAKIVQTSDLPGVPPKYPDVTTGSDGVPTGRNWLMLCPSTTRVGPVTAAEEVYWLSREGGWPTQIYGAGTAGAPGAGGIASFLTPN